MTAVGEVDLVDTIRRLYDDARQAGQAPPGRPTLAKVTGATEHRIRMALAEITGDQDRRSSPAPGGPPTARPDTPPATTGAGGDRPPGDTGTRPPSDAGTTLGPVPPSPPPPATGAPTARPPARRAPAARPPGPPGPPAPPVRPVVASATPAPVGARVVSWAGFVFGSVMSVAANVLHTWLPAAGMASGWSPSIASQVGATVWPIGLLLSVEVLSRVPWKPGRQWAVARFGGTGTVALGAAVISYGHVHDVLVAWGYGALAAHVGPLVLDGLMVVSGFALLAMSTGKSTAGSDPPPVAVAGAGDRAGSAPPADR